MRNICCLIYLVAPAVVAAQVGDPIETRNFRFLSLPFFRIGPRGDVLSKGEQSWSYSLTIANDARDVTGSGGRVHEDAEVQQLLARYRRGIGRDMDFTIDAPLVFRNGGILDPIISWWHHNIIHFPNAPRDAAPFGLSEIDVPGHATYGSAAGIGDVSASLSRRLGRSTVVTAGLKLPTGSASHLIGSGALDLGAAVQHTLRINSRWHVLGQLGAILQGRATELKGSRTWVAQHAFSVMYARNNLDTYVIQWQVEASATVTGVESSDAQHRVVTFGLNRALSPHRQLQLFFTENGDFIRSLAKVGPDFTIGARITTRF